MVITDEARQMVQADPEAFGVVDVERCTTSVLIVELLDRIDRSPRRGALQAAMDGLMAHLEQDDYDAVGVVE